MTTTHSQFFIDNIHIIIMHRIKHWSLKKVNQGLQVANGTEKREGVTQKRGI